MLPRAMLPAFRWLLRADPTNVMILDIASLYLCKYRFDSICPLIPLSFTRE